MRQLSIVIAAAAAIGLIGAVGGEGAAGTGSLASVNDVIVVDDDGVQCPGAFSTLSAALSAAADRDGADEVLVCAGTYPEDLRVSGGGPVRITGQGPDLVGITGAPSTVGPIIHADGERVDLSHLTVDGGGEMGGDWEEVHGVRFDGVGGTLHDVVVDGIFNAGRTSHATAVTIRAGADVVITDAVLDGFAWRGVDAVGAGTRLVLRHSSVVRAVDAPELTPAGVRVLDGAIGTVEDNRIGGVSVASVRGLAAAIDVQCPGPGTAIAGNDVVDADVGVHIADAEGVVARDNRISGPLFNGVLLRSRSGGVPDCATDPVPPTRGNVLLRNEVSGTFGAAILVAGYGQLQEFGPMANRIEQNVVMDVGGNGIAVANADDNLFVGNVIRRAGGRRGVVDDLDRAIEDAVGRSVPLSQSPDGGDDGLRVWGSRGNRFEGNDVRDSFDLDCYDDLPLENLWIRNRGERDRPAYLCAP